MTNPALFYLWTHSNIDQLDTLAFEDPFCRANKVFFELNGPEREMRSAQDVLNAYIARGERTDLLEDVLCAHEDLNILAERMRDTEKRFVIELADEPDFDYYGIRLAAHNKFYTSDDLEAAMSAEAESLSRQWAFQIPRETAVAESIIAIPDTTLVIFGSGHTPSLPGKVAAHRPIELHHPYEGYPLSYETQLAHSYLKTGKIDRALFLRMHMEHLATRALNGIIDRTSVQDFEQAIGVLAHDYATLFTEDQIFAYRKSFIAGKKFDLSDAVLFRSFLEKHELPLVSSRSHYWFG
ncbi:hypothetical protein COV18_06180 [Candidatus Woesearchaeota archaeon CG10_big_fil_rev_8_21_14_0_10_37_12]|nr:MAG: hypothetical protein COV18_06180 [Candidatus Woesearchaeota archaeon CG10_big_fil_rev_8_21_14_0_10_37_12]